MEETILDLTYRYVDAFHGRKINVIYNMLALHANLKDPAVNIVGRTDIVEFIKDLYSKNNIVEFVATKIVAVPEQNFSVIEFTLKVGNDKGGAAAVDIFRGTDHITWNKNGEIEHIEAFLY